MAIEFGCQWLHIRDFDQFDEKSDQHYPEFKDLRADMYEESIRFFEDLFRNDGSILNLLDADYAFVNGRLPRSTGSRASKVMPGKGIKRSQPVSRRHSDTRGNALKHPARRERVRFCEATGSLIPAGRQAATASEGSPRASRRSAEGVNRTPVD